MEGMIPQAQLMGKALIANSKYKSYRIPLFDNSYGWDDVSPRDVTSFAMSHGVIAQCIEMPELNQDAHDALIYTIFAGFKIVKTKKDCDVIVDDSGRFARKIDIDNGKNYIGMGQGALAFIKKTNLLPGFEYGHTSPYHEGLLRAEMAQDSLLTAGYDQHELLYIATGSWIEKAPKEAKISARVSAKKDFYVSGW